MSDRQWIAVAAALMLSLSHGCGDGGGDDDDDDVAAGADAAVGRDAGDPADAGVRPDATPGAADIVVDAAWVLDALDRAAVQVVDVRARASYDAARIPGAVHVDPNGLRATVDGVPGQVAPASEGAAVLAQSGVLRGVTVIVYGDATDTTSARVLWTLQYYGLDDVHLLDGGWGAWQAAGNPTETTPPASDPSSFSVPAVDEALRVDGDWVLAHLDDPNVVLVDARSAGEYASGRIPGALSVDWTRNVSGGAFLPRAQVAALYAEIDASATVVTYCQTGARAAVAYLALRWLGFADVRLYDGSWAEWGSRPDTPKETD